MQQEAIRVNEMFDRQIKKDFKHSIDKELFNLTLDFTLDDWRRMRTQKYWATIATYPPEERKRYTLKCVKCYIQLFKKK